MIPLSQLAEWWNAFFHAQELPATLAVFRAVFGTLLVLSALLLSREATLWFGPHGVMGTTYHEKAYRVTRFTLFNYLPRTDASVRLVFGVHLASAACLALGLLTPLSAAVAFVTLTSIHHRNPLSIHAGDTVMRLVCLLLVFSPAGRMYSLDVALGVVGPPAPAPVWPLRLLQLYISLGYLHCAWWKAQGAMWLDGVAVHYPLQVSNYRRMPLPSFMAGPVGVRVMTWGTLVAEWALGPLVWIRELRYAAIAGGVLLHLGIELTMNVQLFGWTMITCLMLFVPSDDMLRLLPLLGLG